MSVVYPYFTFLAALSEIQGWLRLHFPKGEQSLLPGIKPKTFLSQAREFDFSPPAELIELYAWHNGSADADGFFAQHSFYSLDQAIEAYQHNLEASQANDGQPSWPPNYWPLMGAGNEYFVLDCQTGVVWFYSLQDQPHYAFDGIGPFFACIAAVMHHGMMMVMPDGKLMLHGPGFESLRKQQVSAPGQATDLPLKLEFTT